MSISLMSAVWKSEYAKKTSARLLVMLKLADRADDEGGSCFPAQGTIAEACGLVRTTVNGIIKDLERDGKLEIIHTKKQNHYQLFFTNLDKSTVVSGDSEEITLSSLATGGVVSGDSGVSSQATQYIIDSSGNHQEEGEVQDLTITLDPEFQEKPLRLKKQSSSSPKDERARRPIILTIKGLMRRYPDKLLWDKLITRFGDDFDSVKLRECREAWVERGYNPNAMTWLNWYSDGIPNRQIQHSSKPAEPSYNYVRGQPTQREAIEAEQKAIEAMGGQ
jgi:hypothetical protein